MSSYNCLVIHLAGRDLLHEQLSELQMPTNEPVMPEAPMINVPAEAAPVIPDQINVSEAAPVIPDQNSEFNVKFDTTYAYLIKLLLLVIIIVLYLVILFSVFPLRTHFPYFNRLYYLVFVTYVIRHCKTPIPSVIC